MKSHDVLPALVTEKGDFSHYCTSYTVILHVRLFQLGYSVHSPVACLPILCSVWLRPV